MSKPWSKRSTIGPKHRTWTGKVVYKRKKHTVKPLDVVRMMRYLQEPNPREDYFDIFYLYLIYIRIHHLLLGDPVAMGASASANIKALSTQTSSFKGDSISKAKTIVDKHREVLDRAHLIWSSKILLAAFDVFRGIFNAITSPLSAVESLLMTVLREQVDQEV